jgi:hypothetical protein
MRRWEGTKQQHLALRFKTTVIPQALGFDRNELVIPFH